MFCYTPCSIFAILNSKTFSGQILSHSNTFLELMSRPLMHLKMVMFLHCCSVISDVLWFALNTDLMMIAESVLHLQTVKTYRRILLQKATTTAILYRQKVFNLAVLLEYFLLVLPTILYASQLKSSPLIQD